MSTLKTISIQHPNSNSANIGLGTDGSVSVGTAMTFRPGEMNIVGVATATMFSGNITGTAATFSGAIRAASAVFTGNVSIAGTLTYEDVTNVDSVGLVTARSGVNVTGGNVLIGSASSTGTASQPLQVTGGAYVSGNTGIGTTNPQYRLDVVGDINLTGTFRQNGSQFVASRWTSGIGDDIYRLTGDVGIGTTNPTERLHVIGNAIIIGTATVTTIVETSSITLKENINPIVNSLDKVVQLNPVTYDRKSGASKNEAGLIAEEVNEIIPNIVSKDDKGNPNGINYTKLSVYLIDAIKELKKEIDDLRGN